MSAPTSASSPAHPRDRAFFGHPMGLATLFFTELWERFSYYGMRAILVLFMTAPIAQGGLGLGPETAGPIYAMYTSLVYLVSVPGGWLADKFLGQRRAVFFGGFVIMLGHISLALHGMPFFYAGLGLVVLGTGLLKPNISAIVGQLYGQEDVRRDAGFSIFYMGINLGALIAPLVCGWLAQNPAFREQLTGMGIDPNNAWHFGFGAAAVGMAFGLVTYVATQKNLSGAGDAPVHTPEVAAAATRTLKIAGTAIGVALAGLVVLGLTAPELFTKDNIHLAFTVLLFTLVVATFGRLFTAGEWTPAERARLIVIAILFCGAAIFWGIFEQAGSTLTLFAEKSSDNRVFGLSFDSSWWQSANPILIVLLAPAFSYLWVRLGDRNPSYPVKFAIGLTCAGLGFLWLVGGAVAAKDGGLVGIHWLLGTYLIHTIGELCLSPVGLASMTRLAPARVAGLMMGVWFLAASVGNFIGGTTAGFYEKLELPTLFAAVGLSGLVMAGIMFAVAGPVRRMLERTGASAPTSGH